MSSPLRLFAITLSLLFFATLPGKTHNIHATMTEVTWNDRDRSLELVLEMHAELLEARLSLDLGEKLSFLNEGQTEKLQMYAEPLIIDHLMVSANSQPIQLLYLGLEYQDDHVYIYLEQSLENEPANLRVMNTLFLDDLPGQTNSVVVRVGTFEDAGKISASSEPLFFKIQ